MENIRWLPKKIKSELPHDPAIPLLGRCSKMLYTHEVYSLVRRQRYYTNIDLVTMVVSTTMEKPSKHSKQCY